MPCGQCYNSPFMSWRRSATLIQLLRLASKALLVAAYNQVSTWSIRAISQSESNSGAFIHLLQEKARRERQPSWFCIPWCSILLPQNSTGRVSAGNGTDGGNQLSDEDPQTKAPVSQGREVGRARGRKVLSQNGSKYFN